MSNWLFKGLGSVNKPTPSATALRVQTSVAGRPIPFGYGKTRIASNVLWQGVFLTYPPTQQGSHGKGLSGLGSVSNQAGQDFTYSVWTILGLCEGPINASPPVYVWFNKAKAGWERAIENNSQVGVVQGYFGFTLYRGDYTQIAASIMTSVELGYDLNYRGLAYVISTPMYLGASAELPNITLDVEFALSRAISGSFGADPRDIINDFLTNVHYGVLFPSAHLNTNALYSSYCRATGLVMSPFLAEQRPAADYLREWMQATNSEFLFTDGKLIAIPYGDQVITANGSTYTPPATVPYSLTDADFVIGKSSRSTDDPLIVSRKRIEDQNNSIKIEYLGGEYGNGPYDPTVVEAKDDAAIKVFGLKAKGTTQFHGFTEGAAALLSAHLMLGREQMLNTYEFTTSGRYILLNPMDIVPITDTVLGIVSLLVRIKEITENDDYTLTMIAEDYLPGAASSPAHATESNAGIHPDYNAAPGNVQTPLIFEPTDQLAGGLEIWGAIAGADLTNWGGCEVWSSADGATYALQGRIKGHSRFGTLISTLPTVTPAISGVTLDSTNTLAVDLTVSQGSLASITSTDFAALSTLMYVDGEFIAYQNSTPTSTYAFNLTMLNRGLYGTTISAHAPSSRMCRVDTGIFKLPFTQDRIGHTIYFKFLSFNAYGGGLQSLADVGAFSYLVQGTALSSPLPNVKNFTSSYVGNITYLDWDPVTDFRPVQYEIRKGSTFAGGQFVGIFSHPHVPAIGDATYWVSAVSQPVAGFTVYSAAPTQLGISGSVIGLNLLREDDEGPSGAAFPGTLDGNVILAGGLINTVASVLLLHFDGANNATTTTDSSVLVSSVTMQGSAKISTTQSKFGGSSAQFDQTLVGGLISLVRIPDRPELRPTGDFTIDCWYYPTNSGAINTYVIAKNTSSTVFTYLIQDTGTNLYFYASSAGTTWDIANAVLIGTRTQNAWQHIAITRSGTTWRTFKNGVLGSTFTSALTLYQATGPVIVSSDGLGSAQAVVGFVDEVRIIDSCQWTAAFTPPTVPYVNGQGYYTIPSGHIVDNGRLAPLLVQIIFDASGSGSADFFHPGPPDDNDVFAHTDIFDTAASQSINVVPEISISTDGTNFGAWQKYQPGFYSAWKINARINMTSLDPGNVSATLTDFKLIVYAETRIDHPLNNTSIPAGGQALTFAPDGNGAPPAISVPFTAGPSAGTTTSAGVTLPTTGSVPGLQTEIVDKVAGDLLFISSLTLTGVTVQVKNAGVGVSRHVTVQAIGF